MTVHPVKLRIPEVKKLAMPELIGAVRVRKSFSSQWHTISAFKSTKSVDFNPAAPVKYEVLAKVRNADGTITKKRFWLNVVKPLTNSSTLSSYSIRKGKGVTISSKASGGLGTVKTMMNYKKSTDTSWARIQGYSTNTSELLIPKATGKYIVRVSVKDERGVVVKKDLVLNVS